MSTAAIVAAARAMREPHRIELPPGATFDPFMRDVAERTPRAPRKHARPAA